MEDCRRFLRKSVSKRPATRVILLALAAIAGRADDQPAALRWFRPNPAGAIPSPRIDAPVAYDSVSRELFLFGGLDASGDRNDLWAYSVDNQQWTQVRPVGQAPDPRHGHTVTLDPVRRRIIVVAGQGARFFGDAWAYDIQANVWRQLTGNSDGPLPRYGHSGIYDAKRDRIIISHGFTSEQGRYDDTWALDLASSTWRDISPVGTRPLRRCLHHAVYVAQSDQMLLYGGCSSGYGPCPQGDLWSLDFAGNQWTQIVTAGSPPPRLWYGMVFDDNRKLLVLFGGLDGEALNDTWEYDPAAPSWKQITPGGDVPTPRYRLEATFASDLGAAFFFGGQTINFTNDLLLLSGASPPPPPPPAAPPISIRGFGDVFSGGGGPFAPGEIVVIYGTSLGPGSGATAAFDPVNALLPTALGGVTVAVNGIAAPLYYVSAGQVNVQIPYEVDGQQQASVSLSYREAASPAQAIPLAASAPRLYPGIFNQDGSLNSPDHPAAAGSIVILFATGQGVTRPQSVTGKVAAIPYPGPAGPVRALIGGQDAEIAFAGLAPDTAGVIQVNVIVPAGIAANTAEVSLIVKGIPSQKGVTLAVR
jgi:uncharacterized protein (TIGR03437 family)